MDEQFNKVRFEETSLPNADYIHLTKQHGWRMFIRGESRRGTLSLHVDYIHLTKTTWMDEDFNEVRVEERLSPYTLTTFI